MSKKEARESPGYLTKTKKEYYLDQLNKARSIVAKDEITQAWKMDERLEESIQCINRFACLQTVLSKFPMTLEHAFSEDSAFYIQLAYTRECESVLRARLREMCGLERSPEFRMTLSWYKPRELGRFFSLAEVPDELQVLDAICNPFKYNDVRTVMIYGILEPQAYAMEPDDILKLLNRKFRSVVNTLESVGEDHEAFPAADVSSTTEESCSPV